MKKLIYLSAVIALLFSSCGILYVPNKVNTPFINGKNQLSLSGSWSGSALSLQVAYSKFDHIAFVFTPSYGAPKDTSESYFAQLSGAFAAGYYNNITNRIFFDVYAGGGISLVKNKDKITSGDTTYYYLTSSDYGRLFAMGSLGYISDYFSIALTGKYNYAKINYHSNYDLNQPNPIPFNDFELVLSSLFGKAPVYGNIQIGYIFANEKFQGIYFPLIFNAGLTLKF